MIYGVYTDRQHVRNTSDTVYTTRRVCCEIVSPLDIIWALLSSCVSFTKGIRSLPTEREKKIIRTVLVCLS